MPMTVKQNSEPGAVRSGGAATMMRAQIPKPPAEPPLEPVPDKPLEQPPDLPPPPPIRPPPEPPRPPAA